MGNLYSDHADTMDGLSVLAEQVGDHDVAEAYRVEAEDHRSIGRGDVKPVRYAPHGPRERGR